MLELEKACLGGGSFGPWRELPQRRGSFSPFRYTAAGCSPECRSGVSSWDTTERAPKEPGLVATATAVSCVSAVPAAAATTTATESGSQRSLPAETMRGREVLGFGGGRCDFHGR